MTEDIQLIDLSSPVHEEVELAPFPGEIVVCDCHVHGIEQGRDVVGGYARGRVLNVDHHADTERMQRLVSSTNLALERVAACGTAAADTPVIINHTDCDSVLSSGLMRGVLDPDEEFGVAAIAADHTGAEHPIADLLQALGPERDLELCFRALAQLRSGRQLEHAARVALDDRRRMRARAEEAVAQGQMQLDGPLAWGVFEETIHGEFFPALLPDATVILVMAPRPELPRDRLEMKLRLGAAAPKGFTLFGLVSDFDPWFGGRWNAGSNRRPNGTAPGGSAMSPELYAAALRERVEARLGRGGRGVADSIRGSQRSS